MTEISDLRAEYTRVPGLLWLAVTLTGSFGLVVIRNTILVPNDPTATIANMQASETLFRCGLASTLLSQVLAVFFAIKLFALFRTTNKTNAIIVAVATLLTAGLAAFNTLFHFCALLVINNATLLSGFSTEQTNSLAYTLIRVANGPGQGIVELFWPVSHFVLGSLLLRSKVASSILGYLLMIAAAGFLANLINKYLFPTIYPLQFTLLAQSTAAICILPNILWWSIRGLRVTADII